jgi:hypothetical protein
MNVYMSSSKLYFNCSGIFPLRLLSGPLKHSRLSPPRAFPLLYWNLCSSRTSSLLFKHLDVQTLLPQRLFLLYGQFIQIQCDLWASEPLARVNIVICQRTAPDRHIDHDRVVHVLRRRVRPTNWEHTQSDPEDEENDRRPGDWDAGLAQIEWARLELLLSPDNAAENRCAPRKVVASNSEREECCGGSRGYEAKQTENCGQESTPKCRADRNIAESFGNWAEELREWKSAVARECPRLTRCSDKYGDAHQELNDHEKRHHPQRAVLAECFIVDLGHGLTERRTKDDRRIGVHACRDNNAQDKTEEPAGPDGHDDAVRDSSSGVCGFFSHVNTGIERADRPKID